jgi:predicted ribosome quality control (RQC) complex YloA/Tae2 family protein
MRKFETPAGCTIIVGTNATENDQVTFVHSEPDDLWFHAQGVPGAHVILKGNATPECIQMAASIALTKSKGYNKVDMTQCSNVYKLKNAPPGMVMLKQWTTITSSRQSS